MQGVKNLVVKKHNLPITKIVDELMEVRENFLFQCKLEMIHRHATLDFWVGSFSEGEFLFSWKVEKSLKGSLDSIQSPLPSVKIQTMGGEVCFRYKGKTFLGVVSKLLKTKSLLTSPSNLLPYHLK